MLLRNLQGGHFYWDTVYIVWYMCDICMNLSAIDNEFNYEKLCQISSSQQRA